MDPFDIKPHHSGPTPFTPRIDPEAFAISIAVPAQIVFSPGSRSKYDQAFTYVPVSVSYRVPGGFLQRMYPRPETLLYIATDAQRGSTYVGNGGLDRLLMRPPPGREHPDVGPEQSPIAHTGWATINLAQQAALPAREATYWVHAAFGPYVSNVVRVEVYERRGGAR